MITIEDKIQIEKLLDQGKTGTEISKILHKRKQNILSEIRIIKGIPETKEKIIYRKRYTPKELIKKRKKNKEKKQKKNQKKKTKKPKYEYNRGRNEEIKKVKKPQCKFNYVTNNNIGYIREKHTEIYINEETLEDEYEDNLNEILSILKYYKNFKCPLRQNYIKLEYKIFFEGKENEFGSITTFISLNLDSLKERTIEIYEKLNELIKRGGSPSAIKIYNIIYVNYDFKSYVKVI